MVCFDEASPWHRRSPPFLHEARADGALTVCDALHVAKPSLMTAPSGQGTCGYKRRKVQPVEALKEKPQAGWGFPTSRWNATITLNYMPPPISMVSRFKRPSSVPCPSWLERPS